MSVLEGWCLGGDLPKPRKSEFEKHHIRFYDVRQLDDMFNCDITNLDNGNVLMKISDFGKFKTIKWTDGKIWYRLENRFVLGKIMFFEPEQEGIIKVWEYSKASGEPINELTFSDVTKACEFLYKYRSFAFDNLGIPGDIFEKYLEIKKERESKNEN